MAYLRNSIDDFQFISLEGAVDMPGQQIVVDSRPGTRGMEFTLLGVKGQPFVMVSLVDMDSIFDADLQLAAYKGLIESDPVNVWKNGVALIGFRVKVLNVTKMRVDKINTAVGNKLSPLSGALLECRWDLIAVPVP